jgi:hypothetical protein
MAGTRSQRKAPAISMNRLRQQRLIRVGSFAEVSANAKGRRQKGKGKACEC